MNPLVIAGSLCFFAALLLPAYDSHGFFKIGGRGWKMLSLSMVLLALGFVALFKQSNEKVFFYFIPGLLNIFVVSQLVLGLASVHGAGIRLLGLLGLAGWCAFFGLILLRMRGDLKIGSYLWFSACFLLSINGIYSA